MSYLHEEGAAARQPWRPLNYTMGKRAPSPAILCCERRAAHTDEYSVKQQTVAWLISKITIFDNFIQMYPGTLLPRCCCALKWNTIWPAISSQTRRGSVAINGTSHRRKSYCPLFVCSCVRMKTLKPNSETVIGFHLPNRNLLQTFANRCDAIPSGGRQLKTAATVSERQR